MRLDFVTRWLGRFSTHPETSSQRAVDDGFHIPVGAAHFPLKKLLHIWIYGQSGAHTKHHDVDRY